MYSISIFSTTVILTLSSSNPDSYSVSIVIHILAFSLMFILILGFDFSSKCYKISFWFYKYIYRYLSTDVFNVIQSFNVTLILIRILIQIMISNADS